MTGIYFSCTIHFSCLFGSICASIVARVPVSCICSISSMSTCINTPDMSHVLASLSLLIYITQDTSIDSVAAVGKLIYSFFLYTIFFLPSAYPQPFIFRSLFNLGSLYIQYYLFSYLVNMFIFSCWSTYIMCSWFISCKTTLFPASTNTCSPFITKYCVRAVCYRSSRPDHSMVY